MNEAIFPPKTTKLKIVQYVWQFITKAIQQGQTKKELPGRLPPDSEG